VLDVLHKTRHGTSQNEIQRRSATGGWVSGGQRRCLDYELSSPMSETNSTQFFRVPRHDFDPSKHRDLYAADCEELDELLAQGPEDLGWVEWTGSLGEGILERGSVFDRESPRLPLAARILAQARTALLVLRSAPWDSEVRVPFNDSELVLRAQADGSRSNVGTWLDAYAAALMARDERSLELLAGIDDAVLRQSSTLSDDCMYSWKAALVTCRTDPEASLRHLESAVRQNQSSWGPLIAHPGAILARAACYPLLGYLLRGDEGAFNAGLAAALEAHKAFWGNERSQQSTGWVAREPLALACLARDRGMAIRVESEYLITPLIEHGTRGEAPH